ncbi:palmitoyl-protein thioesterase 1-like [Momordica charantia]|uniref:Palmitoyl-protein thioesterase 1-like n=1 Tax=Momordica charantia TaxID=3673 RepID=A0A6J1DV90_MOMCH|nr:palmitoyl-protein thioesterase 1-like [Momordica charantia]
MPVIDQIQTACDKVVRGMKFLKRGFDIFAISQGALIARGLIEFCDGVPPVKNLITLAGPHAGMSSIPYCQKIFSKCCPIVEILFDTAVYTDEVQSFTTAATYYKVPEQIQEYLKNSKFLPKLNNEPQDEKNVVYKERFSSLNKLVLLMDDSFLIPRETAWFGYYEDGSTDRKVVPATETNLYKEEWIGLKRLNESGKVITRKVPGDHANLPDESMSNFVVPYLVDDAADLALTSAITTKLKLHNNKA